MRKLFGSKRVVEKRLAIALVVILVLALGAKIYEMSVFRPAINFHVVDAGKFYRSAQLTKKELDEVVHDYGIRTVINLRGHQPGEWWYDDESSELTKLGVKLEDIGFSTENVQTREDWLRYNEILRTAQRPILVHCRSGADRTSEATAVYTIDYMGYSTEQAMSELAFLRSLHVGLFIPAKDVFVANYKGAAWLEKSYNPCEEPFRAYARSESHCGR